MKKIVSSILVISILSCVLLSFTSCLFVNDMEDYFDAWVPQPDSNIAVIDNRKQQLYIDETSIDLKHVNEICKNYITSPYFLLRQNKLYGVHSDSYLESEDPEYAEKIVVFCVDIETCEVNILYSAKFALREKADYEWNCDFTSTEYTKIYYNDNILILNDNINLTTLNIETLDVSVIPIDEVEFSPNFSFEIIDDTNSSIKAMKILYNGKERIITAEYMAQRHQYVEDLLKLEVHKNLIQSDTPPIQDNFFSLAFSVNQKIYILCRVYEKDCENNVLVFSYDYETENIDFIRYCFSSDNPQVYVIPREE